MLLLVGVFRTVYAQILHSRSRGQVTVSACAQPDLVDMWRNHALRTVNPRGKESSDPVSFFVVNRCDLDRCTAYL
jgi:hypothetical protein